MSKINLFAVTAVCALLMVAAGSAQAATYYVRTDGGSSTQCTGLTDAAYSGSGSNQACAFNHPFWGVSVAGAPMKMVGGDTMIIGPGQYQMGLGAPNATVCNQNWPWDCFMRAIPSGTASSPTRILGKGFDTGCSSKPQLWGNERSPSVLNLQGSSNVQIQCLEITDHSSCLVFGPDNATQCNRSSYPYGAWAENGIVASDSKNVLLKDVYIHGLRRGILAGRLTDWTLENVDIIANSFVGWDGDIGAGVSSNSGKIIFKNSKIQWSGCGETYPGLQPYLCYSQDQGGYGDGIGTQQTGGDWVFDRSDLSHNVSDGLDLLYHDGNGTITITRSRFEGNAGNQVKVAASTVIDNSKIIGNCSFFSGKSFTSKIGMGNSSVGFNNCRAGGNSLAMFFKPGMKGEIYNSTITSNGDVVVLSGGAGCLSSDKIVSKNNIYVGGAEFNSPGDVSELYYASGQYGNGDGACGALPFSSSNDIIWGTKNNTARCTGTTSKCVDPKLAGPLGAAPDMNDVSLLQGSPAINTGSILSIISGILGASPATDFNNFSRGSAWDVGALEYGSVSSTPSSTPTPAPIPTPDPTPTVVCGNGVVETGEQCDGSNFSGQTCVSKGFASGSLACSSSCVLSTASCVSAPVSLCGNGVVNTGEQCDGSNFNGQTCVSNGFASGNLTCSSCTLSTASCVAAAASRCGNGDVEAGEQCDDDNETNGDGCNNACKIEVAPVCGNGVLETGEQCDGASLNSQTCTSKGFVGGSLACSSSCTFNTTSCLTTLCGNGVVEAGEQCDGSNFSGQTCVSKGFASGSLACNSSCILSTASCVAKPAGPVCGNGKKEGTEICDDGNKNSNDGCSSTCRAEYCGDGIKQTKEACDDGNWRNRDGCSAVCKLEAKWGR